MATALDVRLVPEKMPKISATAADAAFTDKFTDTLGVAQFSVVVTVKVAQLGSPWQA
jgi:hypothetical protein